MSNAPVSVPYVACALRPIAIAAEPVLPGADCAFVPPEPIAIL